MHYAYLEARGDRKAKKKILLINTHVLSFTKNFLSIFENKKPSIIYTTRHPLSALSSQILNNLTYQNGKNFFSKDLFFSFDLIFNSIYDYMKLGKVYVIQLEKLHKENRRVITDFCKIFKIKYEKCLRFSTFAGLTWWGDAISKKWISGINKKFQIKINEKIFFKKDLMFFQYLAEDIFQFYKYEFLTKPKKIYFNFFPMKSELIVWKNSIKHHKKWKHILTIPYFFILRLIFINKFMISKKNLPYSLGSRK